MTRGRLLIIALLSVLATAGTLAAAGGASRGGGLPAGARASVQDVALPGAPTAADEEPPTDTTADTSADDGGGDTGTSAAPPDESTDTPASATEDTTATDDADADGSADAGTTTPATITDDAPAKTHVEHVFVIALAGRPFDASFGTAAPRTYLSTELRPRGSVLTGYRTLGRSGLADRLALIGGQPPNADTRAGCPTYTEIRPTAKPSPRGEITRTGCVYPNTVTTIGDQVTASGGTWRAYVEDIDKGPDARPSCRRPASGAADTTLVGRPGDSYATRLNPFVYYHSLLDLGDCDSSDGPLERLSTDLRKASTTPAYSFIAPNLCHDGDEDPCADGSPGGLTASDAFLKAWVPQILASPAYKAGGLLVVTFAGAPAAKADRPLRTGALLVSPFITPGSDSGVRADPYTLLRATEDVLALRPLARAATAPRLLDGVLAGARVAQPGDD